MGFALNLLLRQPFLAQVTTGHPLAPDEELAGTARNDRLHPFIQDVELRVGNRPSQGDCAWPGLRHLSRGPDRRFGRPIHVQDGRGRVDGTHLFDNRPRQCLAANEDVADLAKRVVGIDP